jgi:hypothetical protein
VFQSFSAIVPQLPPTGPRHANLHSISRHTSHRSVLVPHTYAVDSVRSYYLDNPDDPTLLLTKMRSATEYRSIATVLRNVTNV